MTFRSVLTYRVRQALELKCARPLAAPNIATAMVASPHFDDEVLGCGGTLAWLTSQGATIRLVFMTDGAASHRHLMGADALSAMRREEAIAAARILGCDDNLACFGFPDGKLGEHLEEGIERFGKLIRDIQPQLLFLPCALDAQSDHLATRHIALSALRRSSLECATAEYVVWGWHRWPWCPLLAPRRLAIPQFLMREGLDSVRMVVSLNAAVDITPWLETKRHALSAHRSQTQRLVADARWMILSDVANGEWLSHFFHPHEFFRWTSPLTR